MGSPLRATEYSSTPPSPVPGEATICGATASRNSFPLRRRLLFNRLVRVKKQRILSPRGLVYERKFHAEPVPHRLDCEARGRSARAKVKLRTPRRCDRRLRRKPSVRCAPPGAVGRLVADKQRQDSQRTTVRPLPVLVTRSYCCGGSRHSLQLHTHASEPHDAPRRASGSPEFAG